jgi:hypothetical protein
MSQHDLEITNTDANTGVTFRAAVNAALQALGSCQSGATAPTTTYPYLIWADTANNIMKMRNGANTAWLSLFKIDVAMSDLARTLLDDTSATAFLTTLGLDTDMLTLSLPADVTISAFIKTLLDNADADAARATMGVPSDPAAETAGMRTVGTGAVQACAGNDARLSDTRVPTDGSVTAVKVGTGAVTRIKLEAAAAGDFQEAVNAAEGSTDSVGWSTHSTFEIPRAGTYRIKFQIKGQQAGVCKAWVQRNGGNVGSMQTNATTNTYATKSQDIAGWSVGDNLTIIYRSNTAGLLAYVKDSNICTSNPIIPALTV